MSARYQERGGHCAKCQVNWYWVDMPLLAQAECQVCGSALMRVTCKRKGPRLTGRPVNRAPATDGIREAR